MKYFPGLFFLLSVVGITNSFSQSVDRELVPGYYVVVGAYAETKEDIAIIYVNKLRAEGYHADHGFNTSRNLYFVYLRYFTDLREAVHNMLDTRKQGVFTDAWVRVVPGDIKPVAAEAAEEEKTGDREKDTTDVPDKTAEEPVTEVSAETPADSAAQEVQEEEIVQHDPMTLANTEVFLSLFNATNNRIIDGDVQIVDVERSRLVERVKGNEYMVLPDPKSKSGKITMIAEVFGYRKIQQEFNYYTPLPDTVLPHIELMGTTFIVYFDMVRYRRGDIVTLYNVYFYNDAALMLPESKYELNSLLQLMQENKNYRIRLHGHTNGNYHGKIISVGPSQNFFALADDSKTTTGSARKLSGLRAQVIKDYLVANGVDPSRIEIKAWGGSRPIYDKNSVNARRNVRVEVEMLED